MVGDIKNIYLRRAAIIISLPLIYLLLIICAAFICLPSAVLAAWETGKEMFDAAGLWEGAKASWNEPEEKDEHAAG